MKYETEKTESHESITIIDRRKHVHAYINGGKGRDLVNCRVQLVKAKEVLELENRHHVKY